MRRLARALPFALALLVPVAPALGDGPTRAWVRQACVRPDVASASWALCLQARHLTAPERRDVLQQLRARVAESRTTAARALRESLFRSTPAARAEIVTVLLEEGLLTREAALRVPSTAALARHMRRLLAHQPRDVAGLRPADCRLEEPTAPAALRLRCERFATCAGACSEAWPTSLIEVDDRGWTLLEAGIDRRDQGRCGFCE